MTETVLLVDPHVHRYRIHDTRRWLDAATRNMQRWAPHAVHCLILTETGIEDSFRTLKNGFEDWLPSPTGESCSIRLRRQDATLTMIAGRQIQTAERLEVLALGCVVRIEDGLPVERTLELVRDSGAMAVLPWGVGKWTGRRGRIVAALIERARPGDVYVGDNGNRPSPAPMPKLITFAIRKGLLNLPGSDPLRLRSDEVRPGSYGFSIQGDFDESRPMGSIQRLLAASRTSPQSFGHRVNWIEFAVSQAGLRLTRA